MESIDQLEVFFIKSNIEEIINFLKQNEYIKSEMKCEKCFSLCSFVKYKRAIDKYAWRCNFKKCENFQKYVSIRKNSFFNDFRLAFSDIFRIILKYAALSQRYMIKRSLDISKNSIYRVIEKLIEKIKEPNFNSHKLGSGGRLVQIDETMLNFKCKSHRGRSATNRTDSISIVEIDNGIKRCFAKVIPNKLASTLIPIICENVCEGATIYTDEHRSYSQLGNFGFTHGTVCHKYCFINRIDNVNTQAVESWHNELKRWIKNRKGICSTKRDQLLKEFCFYFNNRTLYLTSILNLLKYIN